MPFTVTHNPKIDCIQVIVQGELDLTTLQGIASEVAAITREIGCKRILNDLRAAHPAEHALDIYQMPQTAKEAGVSQFCKRALVVGNRPAEFRFLETVFINQGHRVKMFADPETALVWLLDT